MSSTSAIGSQVRILYQTNFPTFTPDQVNKILTEKDYISGQSQITNPQDPQIPPRIVPMFSKDNVSIFINQPVNQIGFLILNTIDLKTVYSEISTILSSLNIIPEVTSNINFVCITRSKVRHKPQEQMTSLLKKEFLEELSTDFGEKLEVTSIRLSTSFPPDKGLEIIIEPLLPNPEDHYFININYQTTEWEKFNTFIGRFGEAIIQGIIDEVEKIV